MLIKIFFAVVVRQLFSRFDSPQRKNKYFTAWAICFAVRGAGVVNVARFIGWDIAVYGNLFTYFKEILARHAFLFCFAHHAASVLDNTRAFGYCCVSKKAFAGPRALNTELKMAYLIFRPAF